jgi:hypothetical protein
MFSGGAVTGWLRYAKFRPLKPDVAQPTRDARGSGLGRKTEAVFEAIGSPRCEVEVISHERDAKIGESPVAGTDFARKHLRSLEPLAFILVAFDRLNASLRRWIDSELHFVLRVVPESILDSLGLAASASGDQDRERSEEEHP